jgi:DNA repair exonuclease SbcCD ATPase subunit
MKTSNYILSAILLIAFQLNLQGQTIELKGKVVDGQMNGVPNVKVKVIGESVNVTKRDGSFSLYVPANKEYVTIILENCPSPMVDPYAGRVNIPPTGELYIRVCAMENTKLRDKVEKLDRQIGKLEKERQLSSRHLAQMHKVMLDTILFHENQVQQLSQNLDEKAAQLDEKQRQISALERKVESLQQQLLTALEEKYLQQHRTYKDLSAWLNAYRSRLKDVQRELARVSDCFLHANGCDNFYSAVKKYSEARNQIDETSGSMVEAVGHYWDDKNLADQLEDTYQFIMKTVHEPVMLGTVNEQVINPIKDFSTKKKGRMAAQKESERGAEAAMESLAPLVMELDMKIDAILKSLNENI